MQKSQVNISPHLRKPMIITIIGLLILFGGIFGWNFLKIFFMKRFFASFQPPPVAVSSTKAKAIDWQNYLSSIGVLTAVNGVGVSADASGLVRKIYFQSGQKIEKGDPLIQLDDRVEQENLKNFKAALTLAELTDKRTRSLLAKKAISQSELDQARAKLIQAQALVGKTQVLIDQKLVKAPFSGKVGIRKIDIGEYISPGTPLVDLQSIDPLFVDFSLPEKYLNQLYMGQDIQLTVDVYPEQVFKGKITAIDSQVNKQTHNILIQATIPNKKELLYPGLFTQIKVMLPIRRKVVVVPQTAISYSLYGDSVFVIKETGKDKEGKSTFEVNQTYVTLGDRFKNKAIIEKGVKSGEQVVTSGQLKLQNKTRVFINNAVKID